MKTYFRTTSLLVAAALLGACSGASEPTGTRNTPSNNTGGDSVNQSKPNINVSLASVSFGTVTVGNTGNQTITVNNNGTAALVIGTLGNPGAPFSRTGGSCSNGQTLDIGSNCTINLAYSPTAAGNASGSFSISSNDPDSGIANEQNNVLVSLSGSATSTPSATPNINVSTTALSFGSVNVGSNSSQTFTLSNTGGAALTLGTITTPTSAFAITGGTCASNLTLASNASCTITVRFSPTAASTVSGSFNIPSNDPDAGTANGRNNVQINLSGTGVSATPNINVSSTAISFGSVSTGTTGNQTITVTNSGTGSLTLGTITSPSAPFSRNGGTCSNNQTLSANASCTVIVRFAPTADGSYSGGFNIPSNDPNSGTSNGQNNVRVNLSGSTPLSLSCTAPASAGGTGDILYVIPDANAASCTLPGGSVTYNSISAAMSAAGPDDVIRLMPGTFNEAVFFQRGGTDGHPITLTYTPTSVCANGGEHTAVIDIQGSNNNCVDASYPNLIIDGLEVRNCGYNGIKVDGDANGTPTTYPADSAYGYYSYGYYAGSSDYWGNIRNYNVNGSDNVIIRNNKVHHTGDDGLKIGHTNHIYMLNNEIYRAGTTAGQQGVDMVGVYDSVVCGNYIHDEVNAAWGPQSMNKGIFDKGGSQNILIENNVITDMESPEACLEVGGDTEWYNTRYEPHLVNAYSTSDSMTDINTQILNQTLSSDGSGWTFGLFYILYEPNYIAELMSESRYAVVRGNVMINCDPGLSFRNTYGARVYNNTVINSGASQSWVKIWDDNEADGDGTMVVNGVTYQESNHNNVNLRLYNNLFYNNGSPTLARGAIFNRYGTSIGSGFVFQNNLMNDNNNSALPSMGVGTEFVNPASQLTGNPMLDGLNRPLAGSPAINTGVNLNTLGIVSGGFTDSMGVARPAGGAYDIGAFEFNE